MDRVLLVDDDRNLLDALRRNLRKSFDVVVAECADEGLRALTETGPFAAVLSDMRMPGKDGVAFLKDVETAAPDTVRLMLTGNIDQATAAQAINDGHVFRFLNKPCNQEMLEAALAAAVRQYRLVTAERDLLDRTLNGAVKLLSDLLAIGDPDAAGRVRGVATLARQLAVAAAVPDPWAVETAALMSRIGHFTLPGEVAVKLRERRALSPEETDVVGRLPDIASRLVASIPRLEGVSTILKFFRRQSHREGAPLATVVLEAADAIVDYEAHGLSRRDAVVQWELAAGSRVPQAIRDAVRSLIPPQAPAPLDVVDVPLDLILPGRKTAAPVTTLDGQLLLGAEHEITETVLMRLKIYHNLKGLKLPIRLHKGP